MKNPSEKTQQIIGAIFSIAFSPLFIIHIYRMNINYTGKMFAIIIVSIGLLLIIRRLIIILKK